MTGRSAQWMAVLRSWLGKSPPALALVLVGCASRSVERPLPEARPLGRSFAVYRPAAAVTERREGTWPEPPSPTGPLDLRQALALALRYNPELAAFSWEVRAAEARELQARLLPNPEAGVDVENVAGGLDGFHDSETTIALAQTLLFGPKRSRAMRVAAAERQLAGWAYESKRLDVFTAVVQSFVAVLGAQDRVRIAQETAQIAQEVLTAATRRVEVGDASPVEQTRAGVVQAQVLTELDRAKQELEAARIRLASMWSAPEPRFETAQGTLERDATLPPLEQLKKRLEQNPELMSAAVEVTRREAVLELERARRIPDVTALAGYRRLQADDVNTIVFGFAVPLPVFDRNQAAIREAKANLAQAEWQTKSAEVRVLAALTDAYSELATTLREQQAYTERILPGATEAFRKTQAGYAQGTFDYLEVLTAQETLAKTRAEFVNVLVRLNQAIAAVERLIGEPIRPTGAPPAKQDKQ